MPRSATNLPLSSMLPVDPARWAARRLGVYLGAGLLVAAAACVAGVVPGSPLRELLAESYQRSVAGGVDEAADPSSPLTSPSVAPTEAPAPVSRQIAAEDARPETAQPQAGGWAVQFGAFESWAEASQAGKSARQGLSAGSVTVAGRIRNGRPVYVARLGGLTGAQAGAACELDLRHADICSVLTPTGPDAASQP